MQNCSFYEVNIRSQLVLNLYQRFSDFGKVLVQLSEGVLKLFSQGSAVTESEQEGLFLFEEVLNGFDVDVSESDVLLNLFDVLLLQQNFLTFVVSHSTEVRLYLGPQLLQIFNHLLAILSNYVLLNLVHPKIIPKCFPDQHSFPYFATAAA